jgi:hypothetical protein
MVRLKPIPAKLLRRSGGIATAKRATVDPSVAERRVSGLPQN